MSREIAHDILIVDDSEANLIAIEAALNAPRRRFIRARSGEEALRQLLEHDVALIVLDVAMPGMDGFETARMIRSRERTRTTPIVFLTGKAWQDEEILQAYELGAFDFLVKPIRYEVLRAKTQVFLDLQERTAQLQRTQALVYEHQLEAQRQYFEARELESRIRELHESDRRKNALLAILSHELRNPLQPVQLAIEVMRAEPDRPLPHRMQMILVRQLQAVIRLVDDLIDIARFTTGKLELHPTEVDLVELIDEAIATMAPITEPRHQKVLVTRLAAEGDPVVVRADRGRLLRAISNLIDNAANSTDDEGTIEVVWGVRDDEVFLRVIDHGRGIEPELLPSVFELFVHERVRPNGYGGLGLELALVKTIVELHGGHVHATSGGMGMGSELEISIPYKQGERQPEEKTAEVEGPGRPLRIVLCDDSPDILELLGEVIRAHGHEVTAVSTGNDAVSAIVDHPPDVALIDIGLPDIDGYQVARQGRALAERAPRMIAVTGYGQPSDRAAAFAAGFDDHIVKPASAAKLIAALDSHPAHVA